MATLHEKIADADLVRRLDRVLHAAFLYAGFVPYGVQPPPGHVQRQPSESGTSLCLCRWYTAPQLAHREDAEAAVLMLCAAQGSGDVALVMFLTKASDMRGVYLERLRVGNLALSGSWDDGMCSKISRSLAGGVCRGLLDQLRRRNGPMLPGFMSLPDDVKVEILMRLSSGEDLARVECTCRDLRRIVAERNGDLWKRIYSNGFPFPRGMWPWKAVVESFYRYKAMYTELKSMCDDMGGRWIMDEFAVGVRRARQWRSFVTVDARTWKGKYLQTWYCVHTGTLVLLPRTPILSWWLHERPRLRDTDETAKISVGHHQNQKVPRSAYDKKRHGSRGASTTHSTPSRYRWSRM